MDNLAKFRTDTHESRTIGAILVASGRLTDAQVKTIVKFQQDKGLRFGDAALRLKLMNQGDIDFALSRQFDYPYLTAESSAVDSRVIAAYNPFAPGVEALRTLRNQLTLKWLDHENGGKTLAVVSPDKGDGRSWLVANLAVLFSQLGERTLVIDAALRGPQQHQLFGLSNERGLSSLLAGHSSDIIQKVPDLLGLSVITAGVVPPNPQELLARPNFSTLLANVSSHFDVVLIDTSCGETADAELIAARAKGVVMAVRRNVSKVKSVGNYAKRLESVGATLLGAVLIDY
ncbi:MAG: chain length determinant protein tyrosine kinase EpsG [Gammaproteobacteria bacterium]|nr:chain length determinant protein tyrosine kinase EpsG [Gammaproteobacteria bacterium]